MIFLILKIEEIRKEEKIKRRGRRDAEIAKSLEDTSVR